MPDDPVVRQRVPRDPHDDYTAGSAADRREFVTARTGTRLNHVAHYSFDPARLRGNIENFTGVAQVPIGIAGPLRIDGEHARGDFYVPLATTEGTLVASYNRGMRLLTECGGVKTTVVDDAMQRAPVFVLDDAREARRFGHWVEDNFETIKKVAESTTRPACCATSGSTRSGRCATCGSTTRPADAAGQNMTGKATLAACEWIEHNYPADVRYLLSGNIDTDKKHSRINMLETRGKRVVAEATIKRDLLKDLMGVDTETLFWARQIQMAGSFLVGSANNGAQAANGLTAMFIATGQDVANIAESHAGISYTQLLDNGDYYWSMTLTSLIVATVGGGTGLATQRECLELLGCCGTGQRTQARRDLRRRRAGR